LEDETRSKVREKDFQESSKMLCGWRDTKIRGTLEDVLDKEFFCKVEFVYIQDSASDIETMRTPTLSTSHSLIL